MPSDENSIIWRRISGKLITLSSYCERKSLLDNLKYGLIKLKFTFFWIPNKFWSKSVKIVLSTQYFWFWILLEIIFKTFSRRNIDASIFRAALLGCKWTVSPLTRFEGDTARKIWIPFANWSAVRDSLNNFISFKDNFSRKMILTDIIFAKSKNLIAYFYCMDNLAVSDSNFGSLKNVFS